MNPLSSSLYRHTNINVENWAGKALVYWNDLLSKAEADKIKANEDYNNLCKSYDNFPWYKKFINENPRERFSKAWFEWRYDNISKLEGKIEFYQIKVERCRDILWVRMNSSEIYLTADDIKTIRPDTK